MRHLVRDFAHRNRMKRARRANRRVQEKLSPEELELKFKFPTVENWLEHDTCWQSFVTSTPESGGFFVPYAPDMWIVQAREARIVTAAPIEIRSMFEVSRSCIIYGYLCYPLLTLGTEQLYRVLERAVRVKANQIGCPKIKRKDQPDELAGYQKSLEWLDTNGAIATSDMGMWEAAVWLRNNASHPSIQSIRMPGDALGELRTTADRINQLFSRR